MPTQRFTLVRTGFEHFRFYRGRIHCFLIRLMRIRVDLRCPSSFIYPTVHLIYYGLISSRYLRRMAASNSVVSLITSLSSSTSLTAFGSLVLILLTNHSALLRQAPISRLIRLSFIWRGFGTRHVGYRHLSGTRRFIYFICQDAVHISASAHPIHVTEAS